MVYEQQKGNTNRKFTSVLLFACMLALVKSYHRAIKNTHGKIIQYNPLKWYFFR